MELVFVKNAEDFVQEYSRIPKFYQPMSKLGVLHDGEAAMSKRMGGSLLVLGIRAEEERQPRSEPSQH